MKKLFVVFLILALIVIGNRGVIYRNVVKYKEIGTRKTSLITDKNLQAKIDQSTTGVTLTQKAISEIALNITDETLGFSFDNVSNNPNELVETKAANCIGYTALFSAIAEYIIRKNGLENQFTVEHKIGKLEVWGWDIHSILISGFFKDHDFSQIKDEQTGKILAVDPEVRDYFYIDSVSLVE